jgi:hypothetical protein
MKISLKSMEQKSKEYLITENETPIHFLSEQAQSKLDMADANPYLKISAPDISIPFIVLSDGGVIADNTAHNPKTILENFKRSVASGKSCGAGFMDIYHGNKTLMFRHIESSIFEKKWRVDDVVSALQLELNLYYPNYYIRSH